jgi:hypothetical protein
VSTAAQARPLHTRTDANRSFSVQLYGLTRTEKEFFASICAVLRDRHLHLVRSKLNSGEIAPVIEQGETTWIDVGQVADDLANGIRHMVGQEGGV